MKNTITLAAVAALLCSVALPASAQDAGVSVGAGAGTSTSVDTPAVDASAGSDTTVNGAAGVGTNGNGNAAGSAGANANASANSNAGGAADNTFGSVMSSLNSSADVDLTAVTDESSVTIILLSSLQGNADSESAALDQALSASADAMTELHSSISANAAISAKLEAEGYSSDDVVAIKSAADGSVILYVDDRS